MKLSNEVKELITTNPNLNGRVGLLAVLGSRAYGTSIDETSDIDVRGFAFEPVRQHIGMEPNFDTVVDTASDTTIHSFTKYINLLMKNNPEALEMLGCNEEHYLYKGEVARQLIDNVDKFLSAKIVHTFGSYARSQLHRMETILLGKKPDTRKEMEAMENSIQRAIINFEDTYKHYKKGDILTHIDPETGDLKLDFNFQAIPVNQLAGILSEVQNVQNQYNKLNHRSRKKDDEHIDKHAMHIIRLLLEGIEILTTGKVRTYRVNDRELLLSIRKGQYRNTDGTYNSAYYDLKSDLDKKFDYAVKHMVLSATPNYKWIKDFVYTTNYNIVSERYDILTNGGYALQDIVGGC